MARASKNVITSDLRGAIGKQVVFRVIKKPGDSCLKYEIPSYRQNTMLSYYMFQLTVQKWFTMMRHGCIVSILIVLSVSLFGQNAKLNIPPGCKENYFVTSDNVRLHYLTVGQGEALIFIPGWTMPAEIWEMQIEYFSKNHLVIALDPRAQGKSQKATDGLSLIREATDIKELIDHLRLSSYYLIGWSFAGPVLCSSLELFNNSSTKGIIIVDAPLKIDSAFLWRRIASMKGLLLDRSAATEVFVKGMYKQPQSEAYFIKVCNAALMTPTNSAVALLTNFFFSNDSIWIQKIRSFDRPLLFIGVAEKETMFSEVNKEVKIKYAVIPDAGHAIFVDKPIQFNEIIKNFISGK
jgi:non-heme chloroperoxidase